MNSSLKQATARLEANGYKMTLQRKKVFECMIKQDHQHLSAEEIYDHVRHYDDNIGVATVYRALDTFEKSKIVQHLFFDDGCKRYHLLDFEACESHYHFICEVCGRIIDLEKGTLDNLTDKVLKHKGFMMNDLKIQIYGVCDQCLNKASYITHKKSEEKYEKK